ncbi:MAG: MoaD/ThiS family protein [Candidatus Eremiobacteraeota bacterium]|nr:MoaD/ThiS family protein [Candidatus Eremiobacteraeota bacterium]
MLVRVLAFARVRELLGFAEQMIQLPQSTTTGELWHRLSADNHHLALLATSTRIARNGELVGPEVYLSDGDEVALLPPVGGG